MVAQKTIGVGDTVSFVFGTAKLKGVVVEDRGPIGVNKRHLYRVQVPNDPYEDQFVEMAEDEISIADIDVEAISSDEAVAYLSRGGLLRILHANTSGGRNQPRVWLTRNNLGNVVHTFYAERGCAGGESIPFNVLYENRIFKPKVNDVLEFLMSFGLSDADAKRVVGAVGTAP